jgi:hypothetical protein
VKTSTIIILGVAGVGVLYLATRPSSSLSSLSTGKTTNASFLGQIGQVLGGAIVGAGGTVTKPSSAGVGSSGSSSSSSGGINDSSLVNASNQSAFNVNLLDSSGIDSYDAQGTPDAPVYGIAGIDY